LKCGTFVAPQTSSRCPASSHSASRLRGSIGVAERGGHRGDLVRPAGKQPRCARLARRARVAGRGKLGVVDGHQVGAVLGQVRIVGDHGRHRFAHVADLVPGQHRLQVGQQLAGIGADPHRDRRQADVGAGQHGPHPGQRQRGGGVDGPHRGVRHR